MFFDKTTNKVLHLDYEIRNARPNVSLPEHIDYSELPALGFAPIEPTQPPQFDDLSQRLIELSPVEVGGGGAFKQAWAVEDLPPAEAASNLEQAKLAKNNQINSWRLEANRGTFEHGGAVFACDELSRSDVDGITAFVSLYGAMPPGWPGAWKAKDNSFFPITSVADWKAFVASMVSQGNANFAKAQALKAQLAAATTREQLDSIVW